MDTATFGGRIRYARVHRVGISQRDLAARTGLDPITLSRVEAGIVAPWDDATITRVASILDEPAEELLTLAHAWQPPDPATLARLTAPAVLLNLPRRCSICGRAIAREEAVHETASGRLICRDHLDAPRDYWTRDLSAGAEG